MTASALEGERERCLDAGMDDFLTKPVDPTQLEEVVQRWTKRSGPASAGAASPRGPAADAADPPAASAAVEDGELAVVDEDRRQVLAELVKDGESFFDRTARSFLGRIDGQVGDIRAALAAGDVHATFSNAHLVKGSALNLGLPRVSAAAAAVEARAHDGDLEGVAVLLDDLDREVELAVAELRRRLR
jgi:HPt (histidine-containing phosphotransfer) domain-containing protein